MKKRAIIMAAIALVTIFTVTVPQVSAFAMSALSVFRVEDTKSITITPQDIDEMAAYFEQNKNELAENETISAFVPSEDETPQDYSLQSIDDFSAFFVQLPKELENEQPQLYATDVIQKSFTLNNGETINVLVSPTLTAEYESVTFLATQGIHLDAPSELKSQMWEKLLEAPMLSENIRMQLSAIDPDTRDIYLPVIMGVGRATDLGGRTGYIYSVRDLQALLGALSPSMQAMADGEEDSFDGHENVSALIWTKNDILYALVGERSDGELAQIARSVR